MSSRSTFDHDPVDELSCDLIVHLGSIRNIDLGCRGVYTLQISVHSCEKNVDITSTPVGVFSAPGDVDSFVGDQRVCIYYLSAIRESAAISVDKTFSSFDYFQIPSTRVPISLCQFDEREKTFGCRSFIIRYRDEIHVRPHKYCRSILYHQSDGMNCQCCRN